MRPEISSLVGGFPFLPGPLERSSTVDPEGEKGNPLTEKRKGISRYFRKELREIPLHPGNGKGNPVKSGGRKRNPVTSGES